MKVWKEILEDMRNGVSWSELSEKYRSKSQLYEAFRVFNQEAGVRYKKIQDDLVESNELLEERETNCVMVTKDTSRLLKEMECLNEEKEHLGRDVKDLGEKVIEFESKVADLEGRGYTREIVKEIAAVEKRSGRKLLRQIKTAEEYNNIAHGVSLLKKEKKSLEDYLHTKQNVKKSLDSDIRDIAAQHDELRVRSMTYSDAVRFTEDFFDDGYSVEDLKSLRCGLKAVQIKGNQKNSIKLLVERLLKTKDQFHLETEVKKSKMQLREIKREIKIFTTKRSDIENGIIESSNNIWVSLKKKIEQSDQLARHAIEKAFKEYSRFLHEQEIGLRQLSESMRRDVNNYGALKEEIGKLGENVKYGRMFFDFMNSGKDELMTADPLYVAGVVERSAIWAGLNLPKKVMLGQKLPPGTGLNMFMGYEPSVVLRAFAEVIRNSKQNLGGSNIA